MLSQGDIVCSCGEHVLKAYEGGKVKLRARLLLFQGRTATALCKGCGIEHKVPISLGTDVSPRHVVKTGRKKVV